MKKLVLIVVLTLLSGCAGVNAQYPLCAVLPNGAAGCPSSSLNANHHLKNLAWGKTRSGSRLPDTPQEPLYGGRHGDHKE